MNSPFPQEAVGQPYDIASLKHAQQMTWQAIERIAARIEPGMRESEATAMGKTVLAELDMQRAWHPLLVRFGANTLKKFNERSEGDPVLGDDDIFFIDMGGVWLGHEGDAGATFATPGADAEKHACAAAAKTLYDDVERCWRERKLAGTALYQYAQDQAEKMGWRLNLDIKGHRVSDFPHAVHRGGDLGDFEHYPSVGLWILEIQIAHPEKPFGAFYEDLLA